MRLMKADPPISIKEKRFHFHPQKVETEAGRAESAHRSVAQVCASLRYPAGADLTFSGLAGW
jgi:hypothetical protein